MTGKEEKNRGYGMSGGTGGIKIRGTINGEKEVNRMNRQDAINEGMKEKEGMAEMERRKGSKVTEETEEMEIKWTGWSVMEVKVIYGVKRMEVMKTRGKCMGWS
jgi:hypothetical protein